jgi:protein SCO1/2
MTVQMKNKLVFTIAIILSIVLIGCTSGENNSQEDATDLPIYGNKEFIEGIDKDTIYHTVPFWSFVNQDGKYIGTNDYQGKPYVAYFFFSHCPKICPKINSNMKDFQDATKDLDFNVVAFTVDPQRDSVERLKIYADEYGFDLSNYNFVTGNQKDIYELGVNGFLVPNSQDALAPGGFLHSEKLMLIDSKSRIRGYYEGTESSQVELLKKDLKKLITDESSGK